ncbi:MAG: hypothetical protein Q7R46_01795 [bacterium]|nr:hypothetical protein [bacterium]
MSKNNVVFYTGISRAFRTTSIANLHEICQVYPTVLLSEELDKEIEEILKNKALFPKLEKIIQVRQFTGEKMNLFSKNIYLHKLAKNIIRDHKPAMVIMPTDTYLFDFYLMRFAKKIKALTVVLNSDLRLSTAKEMSLRVDLTHIYFDFPSFIPFKIRLPILKLRKYFGYFFYNWLLPILTGEVPFFGKSSRILYSLSGFRADFRIVCSQQDYNLSKKEGIPEKKIALLLHPLGREATKRFFEKFNHSDLNREHPVGTKIFTLLYPEEPYGFKRSDCSLISEKELQKNRMKIVSLIADTLKGWKIFIKSHPATPKFKELKNIFESISPFVTFTNPSDPVERYLEISDIIAGFPPATSVIITALLQCPAKPIISLDLPPQEIFGDSYKDFAGVEYIDSEEKLASVLGLIRDNKYQNNPKAKSEKEGFSGTVELVDYLLRNQKLC